MHALDFDPSQLPGAVLHSPYLNELTVALTAARDAGLALTQRWNRPIDVRQKGVVNLVSEADLEAERIVVSHLQSAFPSDGIIAEEDGEKPGQNTRVWHIDPLDGTTNFTHGFPQFATSIALVVDEQPIVGVVYDPLRNWYFFATSGGGAFLNSQALKVSGRRRLEASLLATGFPYDRWTRPDNNVEIFGHFLRRCQGLRRAGAAALDLAFVAAGWLDGYWEKSLSSWDIAAGILLVREAGGCVTTYSHVGATVESVDLVATNEHIHGEVVDNIRSAMEAHR
ncbi:MAG: inositol monophosphatase family protein [Myxococcota bacterium]|nr:inositol monophosphatase family protein [Myxococcota bacterium]